MDLMPCATLSCMEFGDDAVGRAAYICSTHRIHVPISATEHRYSDSWEAPWTACRKVWAEWQKSEAARQLRAAEAEEQRQIDFVNTVAGALK